MNTPNDAEKPAGTEVRNAERVSLDRSILLNLETQRNAAVGEARIAQSKYEDELRFQLSRSRDSAPCSTTTTEGEKEIDPKLCWNPGYVAGKREGFSEGWIACREAAAKLAKNSCHGNATSEEILRLSTPAASEGEKGVCLKCDGPQYIPQEKSDTPLPTEAEVVEGMAKETYEAGWSNCAQTWEAGAAHQQDRCRSIARRNLSYLRSLGVKFGDGR
jgi:hypothetical protein